MGVWLPAREERALDASGEGGGSVKLTSKQRHELGLTAIAELDALGCQLVELRFNPMKYGSSANTLIEQTQAAIVEWGELVECLISPEEVNLTVLLEEPGGFVA